MLDWLSSTQDSKELGEGFRVVRRPARFRAARATDNRKSSSIIVCSDDFHFLLSFFLEGSVKKVNENILPNNYRMKQFFVQTHFLKQRILSIQLFTIYINSYDNAECQQQFCIAHSNSY